MLFRWLKVFIAASLLHHGAGALLAARGYDPRLVADTRESPFCGSLFRGAAKSGSPGLGFLSR